MADALPRARQWTSTSLIVGARPGRPRRRHPPEAARRRSIAVVVVEKGSEVGAHILSGAVIDPIGLDRLLPEWRNEDTPAQDARSPTTASIAWPRPARFRLPNFLMPPLMCNHGNFVVSLGNVCRWLATKAEALGVEIYPGFAAAELLFDDKRRGRRRRHRRHGHRQGRQAEGRASPAAWSCARNTRCSPKARAASWPSMLIAQFRPRRRPRAAEIRHRPEGALAGRPEKHRPGLVQHSFGWPLDN